ncbi:hypothetical protein NQ315_003601, partial [Exocentrus adspersus]
YVRIPPFIASDPELWFSLLEGSFDAAGITQDSTKYGYAVGGLEAKYAVEVRDIIVKPKNEQLAAIKISHRDNNRRDRSRPRSRSRSRPRDNGSQHEKCWYHYKFGTQARKCREPCSFNAESPGNAMDSR